VLRFLATHNPWFVVARLQLASRVPSPVPLQQRCVQAPVVQFAATSSFMFT
jgi:hypothetical protein